MSRIIAAFLILSTALVLLSGTIIADGIFTKWLFYETWDSFDWTYSASNPSGSEFEIDADSNLVAASYGTPRVIYCERPLECPVRPGADFAFEAHMIVETDPTNSAGGLGVELLSSDDQVAAQINWYD